MANANESTFGQNELCPWNCERQPLSLMCRNQASLIKPYLLMQRVYDTQLLGQSRGADEGIELLIRAFCTPARNRILICPPTLVCMLLSAAKTCKSGWWISRPIKKCLISTLDLESPLKPLRIKSTWFFICSPK